MEKYLNSKFSSVITLYLLIQPKYFAKLAHELNLEYSTNISKSLLVSKISKQNINKNRQANHF